MVLVDAIPVWLLASLIFLFRVVDVSLGTMRTLSVVQGRVGTSVALGFVELLIWVAAISQVVANMGEYPVLAVAYAGGFAAGNGAGIVLERKLALGSSALRIVTTAGREVAAAVSDRGRVVTTVAGATPGGDSQTLLYVTCARRHLQGVIDRARGLDPDLFYVVERYAETSKLAPLPQPTGWRAVLKKK